MLSHTLALVLLPLLCYAAPQKRTPNPTVTIASASFFSSPVKQFTNSPVGVVVGTASAVSNQPQVTGLANAYLGLPFASSPPARFGPPEPPKAWSSPLIAQKQPAACLQQFFPGAAGERTKAYFNNPGFAPPAESEDCLYLNVFAPQDASPTSLKPVLFWIFGGNLQFGTASLAYYNGSSLAVNHDVVVVAINYRTNMFGFSGSPEIPTDQQNAGLLDQRLALQWVQDNIASFGGDPSKVTLFGESAGGFSVKQLLANPPNPLPFRAAILQSQGSASTGLTQVSYAGVAKHFGCSDAPSTLACLRKVPGTDIENYITENALGFPPVSDAINSGGNTLPSILSGKFANVPILIGSNSDEFTVFANIAGLDGNLTALTEGFNSTLGIDISPVTAQLQSTLLGKGIVGGEAIVSRLGTDLLFTCTTATFSSAVVSAGRQPVWRYKYDAAFPNLMTFPNGGAYHSSEIPSIFGTYPLVNPLGRATQTQIELSAAMQTIWSNFAKDPAAGPGWPQLGSNHGVELGVLGGRDAPSGEHTDPLILTDYLCPIFAPILIAGGLAF